jgi:hypothetical protein
MGYKGEDGERQRTRDEEIESISRTRADRICVFELEINTTGVLRRCLLEKMSFFFTFRRFAFGYWLGLYGFYLGDKGEKWTEIHSEIACF